MQGSSILAMLEGAGDIPVSKVGYELFGMKAYIADEWKILSMQKPFGTGKWELFNLEQDPAELKDLSKSLPDKLKELIALWDKYKEENGVLDISVDLSENVK